MKFLTSFSQKKKELKITNCIQIKFFAINKIIYFSSVSYLSPSTCTYAICISVQMLCRIVYILCDRNFPTLYRQLQSKYLHFLRNLVCQYIVCSENQVELLAKDDWFEAGLKRFFSPELRLKHGVLTSTNFGMFWIWFWAKISCYYLRLATT